MVAATPDVPIVLARFHAAALTGVRCAMEQIHAPAADRNGGAVQRAKVVRCAMEIPCGLGIRYAMGDRRFGLALETIEVNRQLRAMDCCVPPEHDFHHFPAAWKPDASEQESVQPVDSPPNGMVYLCE